MMMSMLEAGGLEPYTDGLRKSDEDNPKGYYEVELVKGLKTQEDKSWVAAAEGKVIKVRFVHPEGPAAGIPLSSGVLEP